MNALKGKNEWMNAWMNEWTNERTTDWKKNKWMKWMKWMKWNEMNWNEMKRKGKEIMGEWMNDWMNEWMKELEWVGMSRNELEWIGMNRNESKWTEMNGIELSWVNEWNEMKMKWKWNEMKMNWKWNELKWKNEWTDECMNEWMTEWMNEWVNEWINESINQWSLPTSSSNNPPNVTVLFRCEIKLSLQSRAPFPDLIFQKCSKHDSFFTFFYVKSNSGYSLVHIWPAHLPKVIRPQFFTIFVWNRALATVSCTSCQPHLQKCSEADSFLRFLRGIELATVLYTFCRPLLQIKARNRGNRDPTSATTEAASESVFKVWWCGWHDGMMMWLPWRWEWWPWQSSITWKFSN